MIFKTLLFLVLSCCIILSNYSISFASEIEETFKFYALDYYVIDNAPFSTAGLTWTQPNNFRTASIT